MNKSPLLALATVGLSLASPLLHAQEVARVLSTVAIVQQIAVPRQVCTTQQVSVEQHKSGGGAVLGAVAGGAVGNQIGRGDGRALATIAGVIGGAMLGDRIEGQPGPRVQEQTVCNTQTVYESRTVGYDVTYEYAGRQYRVQTPQDPGPNLRVQVSPLVPPMPSTGPGTMPMSVPARPYSVAPAGVVLASYPPVALPPPMAYPVAPAHGWHRHHGDWR